KNAVNLPSIPAHVMEKVQPYFTLGEKLGHFLAQVTVGSISEISIKYSGELTDVDTSPLTRTVLKGVLSFRLGEEVNYVNAPILAKVRDITVTEQKAAQNKGFTNLLTVSLKTTQETRTVAGTRLNGYGARIVKIDDFAIDVAPEGYLLYIHHNDRPGVIGRVGSILGENSVNIATMQVGRRDIGGDAIMMLSVDKPLTPELLDTMGELAEVKSVTQIEL
ncbi:ACT domain-containing protein, partial [Brevibacillus sp. NRRL NRS-603]